MSDCTHMRIKLNYYQRILSTMSLVKKIKTVSNTHRQQMSSSCQEYHMHKSICRVLLATTGPSTCYTESLSSEITPHPALSLVSTLQREARRRASTEDSRISGLITVAAAATAYSADVLHADNTCGFKICSLKRHLKCVANM